MRNVAWRSTSRVESSVKLAENLMTSLLLVSPGEILVRYVQSGGYYN